MSTPPHTIGAYQVERLLARGGMASVFLARDLRDGRRVALKQILPEVAEDEEFVRRFRHEVRIHAALRHKNILTIHEFEAGPERYYIAMELAEGGSLRGLLGRTTTLPVDVALFIVREVLGGLSSAHAAGVIHRDVKPPNVLLAGDGTVKVADFGISRAPGLTRLTHTGDLLGTPAYMSPEQAGMLPLDQRSDVFSCGVVLYELLCGVNPFDTGSPVTTLKAIVERTPAPLTEIDPALPVECETAVERMLAKRPDDRFPTAAAAQSALDARLAALGVRDGAECVRRFLAAPAVYRRERYQGLAREHLLRARALLASGLASDEAVLAELYQAAHLDPESPDATELLTQEATRAGYSLIDQAGGPRVAELERRIEADPYNAALLLQLAKQHKLARRFPPLMRAFARLRELPIADRYLQGQVAALVGRAEAGPAAAPALAGGAVTPPRPAPVPAERAGPRGPAVARPAPGRGAGRPVPPAQAPAPAGPGAIPLPFAIGFGVAALLVLLGLLRLLLG